MRGKPSAPQDQDQNAEVPRPAAGAGSIVEATAALAPVMTQIAPMNDAGKRPLGAHEREILRHQKERGEAICECGHGYHRERGCHYCGEHGWNPENHAHKAAHRS